MANTGVYRRALGEFELVALHEGVVRRDWPAGFVRNVDDATVQAEFRRAGMAPGTLTITFTALLVKTTDGLVLIDTGMGAGGPPGTGRLLGNLAAAGFATEEVTDVVISHFHGDHIMGLRRADGGKTFENATVHVPKREWAFWMDQGNREKLPEAAKAQFDGTQKVMAPLQNEVVQYDWGETILPGLVSVDAHGHTPGMSAIEISSGGERALFVADITNNPLIFARHPSWQAVFDMDPEAAVATRRRLLGRAAEAGTLLFFFHAPFPGFATVVARGEEYEYLPALWD